MLNSVSIIISAFNGRHYIEETINSCLQQTHKNLQVIIIDDGSTDGTRDLLLSYKDRVKLIFNEKNVGIAKNVNKGVNEINSEFFILLGHDDVLPKNHVELMISEFNDDIVGVHCNSILIDSIGNENGFSRNDIIQEKKTENCLFELSLDNFISSCGMIHRTSIFKATKGWDETYRNFGEWLYYIKALEHGKIKYTTNTYAYYRRHDTNITNTFKDKNVIKKLNTYKNTCRKLAHKKNANTFIENIKYYFNRNKQFIKVFVS
ncbi:MULTISPECIES: glycosyltransferase [unclassified Vibrio]|uniref:glycosyltransferase n=1 Tax=unclassified Vibrio TaxID=2614977 RepID=UPI001482A6A0|nr:MULTISPECIES: glycosyltransferase [unclassified Vibrio]NNN45446.1 glycosyltransferase [Vibrio sp. 1-1(7)]NNN73270.1 glycosyltransferase [Vibrio sp. 12-2(3-a)]